MFRSYTVREFRPAAGELDIDFVVHGDRGVAGPWASRAQPGDRVAILDQGRGFDLLPDADVHLLVGDESAMPAIAGILRDLPRNARGLALIEVPEAGEQALATEGRRHLVAAGVPKSRIAFVGYWRAGRAAS